MFDAQRSFKQTLNVFGALRGEYFSDGSFNRCLPVAAAYLIRHQSWDMVQVKNLLRKHYTFGRYESAFIY